jgi:chaperone required for assembly of F1-ATPase
MADAAAGMRRFYKQASIEKGEGGFAVLLDGRPVKTPVRAALRVPSQRLAEAIAEEWNRQGEKIDPHAMPLTGLANAAIDRIAPDPAAFACGLASYGESDLLCYRAESPPSLVRRQAERWDPILAWARSRYDVEIETACGITYRAQPERTLVQLRRAVETRDAFELAALAPLVTISGSLLIALALIEGAIGAEEAWAAATLDEAWQAEKWGEDALAAAALEAKRREFEAALRFLSLL